MLFWNSYTDSFKNDNPLSLMLTSKSHLMGWILWSSEERFSFQVWRQMFENGSMMIIKLHLPLLLFYKLKYWKQGLLLFLLGLVGPILFTYLYYIHGYYFVSDNFFVALSLGFLILSFFKVENTYLNCFGLFILGFVIYVSIYKYNYYCRKWLINPDDGVIEVSEAIKKYTPNKPIAIYGFDWNPQIAFYSERKAVMLKWRRKEILEGFYAQIRRTELNDEPIGALVIVEDKSEELDFVANMCERLNFRKLAYENNKGKPVKIFIKE